MNYQLATTKSGITKDWKDQKFLMLGASGIGKSTFWSFDEQAGYLEAEAGLNFLDVCKNPVRSWDEIGGVITALLTATKEGKFPYTTFVVDTIDRVIQYIDNSVMDWAKTKYKDGSKYAGIGDIPEGAGWYERSRRINKFMEALEALPCSKVIIGHLEHKKINEDGDKYDKNTINIGGKVGLNLLAWSDHTLLVQSKMVGDQLKRTVYTKPTKSRECKSRGGIIKDGWVWGSNDEDNFIKLREQFD